MAVRVSYTESEFATSHNPSQRKVVRLSNGILYAVYFKAVEYLTEGNVQIWVKKSGDNGLTWSTEETKISTYSGMEDYGQYYPSIAVDSNDNLHVVWHGCATGYITYSQIWYAKFDGSSWSTPVRISTYSGMNSYNQRYGSIAVDSNNNLHLVWYGCATGYTANSQVWYSKYTTSWSAPVRISIYDGMGTNSQYIPAIAVDSNNYLHVVWGGNATGYTTAEQIWYAKYTASWSPPIRISTYSGMNSYNQEYPSVVADSNDNLHVVWRGCAAGYTTFTQIWYRKYTTSWSDPVRISTYSGMENYAQDRPSVVADSSNYLYVIWHGEATGYTDYNKVWYTKYITSWATPECLQSVGQNTRPAPRWSRYPSCNIPYAGVDYVFTEGTASPWEVLSDKKGDPFPPTPIPNPLVCKVLIRKH